jgi:hypothetical protein
MGNLFGGGAIQFQGIDIEYFFIKYRSIIDYSIDSLGEFYAKLSKKNYSIEEKMSCTFINDL